MKTYYDGTKTISYNSLFNFIIGGRSIGKTFFFKKYCINNFIKKKKQFIYVRRYKEELQKTISSFFDDVKKFFPNNTFSIKGNKFYIDGEIAGFYFALSTANILKSMSFPNVYNIIFDEFIIEKGVYRYLHQEVKAFLNFYDTISRDRDIKVYFLANAITMTNPYFLYFNINSLPKNEKNFQLLNNNLILFEYVNSDIFLHQREKTKFGQLIKNTDYGNFSLNNQFLLDNKNFIEKKSGKCVFYFAFKFNSTTFGVWQDIQKDILYISYDYNKNQKFILTTNIDDHNESTILLKNLAIWKEFTNYYKYCQMRFETINIKNQVYNLIKSILN